MKQIKQPLMDAAATDAYKRAPRTEPVIYFTWCDRFCELLKYILFISLSAATHYLMQVHALRTAESLEEVVFTWRDFGLSLLVLAIHRALYDKFLLVFFDMEALGQYDRVMLSDDDKNWTNIMGACRFEKQDYGKLKDHVFERLKGIHRCKSKMVKFFGVWYYKKMSDEEFEKQKDIVF